MAILRTRTHVHTAEEVPGTVRRPRIAARRPTDEAALHRRIKPPDRITRRSLAGADCIAIAVALAIAERVIGPGYGGALTMVLSALTLPVWVLLFKLYGLYDRDSRRITRSTLDDLPHLLNALVLGSLGLWAYSKLVFPERLQLAQGVAFFAIAFALILLGRTLVRDMVAPAFARERLLLIGDGRVSEILLRKIRLHREYGLDPVGYMSTNDADGEAEGIPHLGNPLDDLESACRRSGAHRVVISAAGLPGDKELVDVIRRCSELNLKVAVVPNLVEVLGSSVVTDDVEGVAVLGLSPPIFSRSSRLMKRALDVTIAACVLVLAAPVLALAAIAIKLTSRGPVLFKQERVGRGECRFRIYKLRTMVQGAEAQEAGLKEQSRHSAWLLLDEDPRVTRVGRLLRRTSIDELPQLFNVLKGHMSLVGPRPMPPAVDEQIAGWGRRRLDLTPGVTGLWQVLGRTTIPFEEMVDLDYLYVTNWSLWQDFRLLLRTLPTIVSRRGVN